MNAIYTIGHSTRSIDEFVALLKSHGVRQLIDIRTIPKSRHNPQYHAAAFKKVLRARGIGYRWMKALGGLRRARIDSPNKGWRNSSFRGYADYMQTPEFAVAVEALIAVGKKRPTVIVCAEAVPWRCHRSLIADALAVRGIEVKHIMSATTARPHALTRMARVKGKTIVYPADQI